MAERVPDSPPPAVAPPWTRVSLAFVLAWAVLDRTASWTGSLMGEAGLLVGAAAVVAAWIADATILGHRWQASLRELGSAPLRAARCFPPSR